MESEDVPVVVYDASVLFPFQVAHLLIFMASARLVRAHWTVEIEREWVERSLQKLGGLERASVERRRDNMNAAVPDAKVSGYEHRIEGIAFPDPDDRHVVAAALECGAGCIVTNDRTDFNETSLAPYGMRRVSPDALLCERHEALPELMVEVADSARRSLTKSRPGWRSYLDVLSRSGLPAFAASLRERVIEASADEPSDSLANPVPGGYTKLS